MSEMICQAVDRCLRAMDFIESTSPNELSGNISREIQVRLQKVVQLLRGFEKRAWLKTKKGREAAHEIEETVMNLEEALCSLGSSGHSLVIERLSLLEQRVNTLKKTIERLKRMVT